MKVNMKQKFSTITLRICLTMLCPENLLNVSWLVNHLIQITIFVTGKDIEIALTEIRQLQNHIDSLVREEQDKKNIIQDLIEQRNELQKWVQTRFPTFLLLISNFQSFGPAWSDHPFSTFSEAGGLNLLLLEQVLHTHRVCHVWYWGYRYGGHAWGYRYFMV